MTFHTVCCQLAQFVSRPEFRKQAGLGIVELARRARLSNLVIYAGSTEQADKLATVIPEIVSTHPARVLLLIGESGPEADLSASVNVWCQVGKNQKICSEEITLRASGSRIEHLPFAVRTLVIGDLPTNLFWLPPVPPPLGGALLYDLAERAQQVIYDSNGWLEPANGVVMTAGWLEQFRRESERMRWRVAADLNWRRLKFWRRLLSQALDPVAAPGALTSINDVLIEHGPHAVVQAWELMSWLAARLHWQVLGGRVQPGVELGWRASCAYGPLGLRIRRLSSGPSEIRRVRIACAVNDRHTALVAAVQDEARLALQLEGSGTAPRTVTVPPQPLAELVSRQLSDREYDPVFYESMAVAQVFARSVMG